MILPNSLSEMVKSAWMTTDDLPAGIHECEAMAIVREKESEYILSDIKRRIDPDPEWVKKANAAAHVKTLQARVLRVHLARLLDGKEAAERISNTRLAVARAKLDAVLRVVDEFDDETQAEVREVMAEAERVVMTKRA